MGEFVVDLRNRQQDVWTDDAWAEHVEHTNKLVQYHHWIAPPLRPLPVHDAPFSAPRYLYLDLGKHLLRNIMWKTSVGICILIWASAR
eukprot:557842-Pelagomonas_calceolata.AAC.1